MANELQASYVTGRTCYFLVRDKNANIWNQASGVLQSYVTANYQYYPVMALEQGVASAYYVGSMSPTIPAGLYNAVLKQQLGADPAESDPTTDAGSLDWNGSNIYQVSDIAISGTVAPIQLQRGVQILNYPIYLKSSVDHVTPFTSGNISGQISKNGGAFGPLQSGAFQETGFGVYSLQALTSGDTGASTFTLMFTGNGISGGSCDPLVQTFITQHSSGY